MKYTPLLIFAMLCVLFAFSITREKESVNASPLLNKPFPALMLQEKEVNALLGKRVTMVNMFASWCLPCTSEQPILMKIKQQNILPIIGIAWKNKEIDVTKWLEKYGMPYEHILLDEIGESTIKLALTGVPETFIVDKKGITRYHTRQPISDDELAQIIIPLVKKWEEE